MAKRKFVSVPEAGMDLNLSRGGAYAAVRRGEIPAIRIGRRLLVPADFIDRLLARAGHVKRRDAQPEADVGDDGEPDTRD